MDGHRKHRQLISRRAMLTGLAGLGATACSTSPTLNLLGSAVSSLGDIGKTPGYGYSDAQIEALPYASLGLRIGRSAPAVLILASIEREELHWASADRVVLVTRHGRLIKSVGLPRDLVTTRWTVPDPLSAELALSVSTLSERIYRYIDLRPQPAFSVPVSSHFEALGDETVILLGHSHDTVLIREKLIVHPWRWAAENLFWIDKINGRVWKSRQQYCPEVPPMTFELLKPPALPAAVT